MFAGKLCLTSLVFVAVVFAASNLAWGLGFELGETKEQLKLQYDVSWMDHHTGRVTIHLTIADAGRLGPLRSAELNIRPADGSDYSDLSTSLAARDEDGRKVYSIHMTRELAERAELRLVTDHLDGKQLALTWYYHRIPLADQMTAERQIPNPPLPQPNAGGDEATPPPASPSP